VKEKCLKTLYEYHCNLRRHVPSINSNPRCVIGHGAWWAGLADKISQSGHCTAVGLVGLISVMK